MEIIGKLPNLAHDSGYRSGYGFGYGSDSGSVSGSGSGYGFGFGSDSGSGSGSGFCDDDGEGEGDGEGNILRLIDYIHSIYGKKRGCKAAFARTIKLTGQRVNSMLAEDCWYVNQSNGHIYRVYRHILQSKTAPYAKGATNEQLKRKGNV